MSSQNEGSIFAPRKLNPYENELQFEYQRVHTTQTQNMMRKHNIQQQQQQQMYNGQNVQVINVLQTYPEKLSEKPIYDSKQQQFLIIKDQDTDQEEHEQENEQTVFLSTNMNQFKLDEFSGAVQKKKNVKQIEQGIIKLADSDNVMGSPIDLRKIEYEEEDLKRQRNINNIILEIDKNERAMKKLKYMWPSSKFESQRQTGNNFRQTNDKYQNQTIQTNNSNIQWDNLNKSPPSNSHQNNNYLKRRSSINNDKTSQNTKSNNQNGSNERFKSNKDQNRMIQTQNSFAITPQDKQGNIKKRQDTSDYAKYDQLQEQLDHNDSTIPNAYFKNYKMTVQTEHEDNLDTQEDGLRNILHRQQNQKKQDHSQTINQSTIERTQILHTRGGSRYTKSRSQTRNNQQTVTNNTQGGNSTISNQVSPRIYDNDFDNSFAKDIGYTDNRQNTKKYLNPLRSSNNNNNDVNNAHNNINKNINDEYSRNTTLNYDDHLKRGNSSNQNYRKTLNYNTNDSDDENIFRLQKTVGDGKKTVNYDTNVNFKRETSNDEYKRTNTTEINDYSSINSNRQATLKSRVQSRQKSRQTSPMNDMIDDSMSDLNRNVQKQKMKTQQDYLPRINNGKERDFQTEANFIEEEEFDEEQQSGSKVTKYNEKRRFSTSYGDSRKAQQIKFSDPFIQQQLIDFENEQRFQNNKFEQELIRQEQTEKKNSVLNKFNQTTKGNRQFNTLEEKRNIKTSQNPNRTLDQQQQEVHVEAEDSQDLSKKKRNSSLGQNLKQQRAHSKFEMREKVPVENNVRYSVQTDQFKEVLRNKKMNQHNQEKKELEVEFEQYEKEMIKKRLQNQKTNEDDSFLYPQIQMDKDILKKQQLMNILNNTKEIDLTDHHLTGGQSKSSRGPSTAKKTAFKTRKEEMQDSELTQKRNTDSDQQLQQPSSVYFKGKSVESTGVDMKKIFEDIEKRKKNHRLDDKDSQRIYSYGDYTIIHHPKQESSKLLGLDENSQNFENFNEGFGEQLNDFLDVAIDCHENSKKLSPPAKYKLPHSPRSPVARNHLNNITNNYKVKKQQQRSKSVMNNPGKGKMKSKKQSQKKMAQYIDYDESKRIAVKMTYIPSEYSSRSEQYLRDLLAELKIYNPLFSNISYFTGVNILRLTRLYVFEEGSFIYQENQPSNSSFLILYGKINLSNNQQGEFKECYMGETLGEEAVLGPEEKKSKRFENAVALVETSMCELNRDLLEKFKVSCAEKGLQEDYLSIVSMLKRNFIQKKTLRLMKTEKIE